MELKEFIKEAIRDVSEAISESNEELSDVGAIVNPKNVQPADANETVYGHMVRREENLDFRRPVHLINFEKRVE